MDCPIILDTDPGIDDAVALMVLRRFCPERVKLLLASYGNVSLERTVNNALTMLELLDWQVPVVRGADGPPRPDSPREDAAHVHGADGLAGLGKSFPRDCAWEGDFLQRVYDALREAGQADYIILGPMTNLALLLKRFPQAKERIRRVIAMGGGIGLGNVTPEAEFNIHCDPFSAAEVLCDMPEVVLAPLNVTNRAAFSLEEIGRMTAGASPAARAMERILTMNYHACVQYGETGSTMHDSTAVLCGLFPELFRLERCGIAVDCGEAHYGRTVRTEERQNVSLAVDGDIPAVLRRIAESIP